MQPYPVRFTSLDNQTVQISSRKGYLQHRFGNSGNEVGKLKFSAYI